MAARGTAWILGAHPTVDGVLAHRSTATGEILFARSDIDLILLLRESAVTPERMLSLIRLFRTIKCANIALGEAETHLEKDWLEWFEVDSYRGSMERRSALRMYGPQPPRPRHAVRQSHAIRRFVLWFKDHADVAWKAKNQRNLRKIALEMWNAYAVAIGLLEEPLLTRPEMEAACLEHEDPTWVKEFATDAERTVQFMLELAGRLHEVVAPPLRPLTTTQEVHGRTERSWSWVLLPGPEARIPELSTLARHASPEMFDLYFRYGMPFDYEAVPKVLRELGLAPPTVAQQTESLLFHYHGQVLRYPGLMHRSTTNPIKWSALAAAAVPRLESGEVYAGPAPAVRKPIPTIREYYLERFTTLTDQHARLWPKLSALPKLESV